MVKNGLVTNIGISAYRIYAKVFTRKFDSELILELIELLQSWKLGLAVNWDERTTKTHVIQLNRSKKAFQVSKDEHWFWAELCIFQARKIATGHFRCVFTDDFFTTKLTKYKVQVVKTHVGVTLRHPFFFSWTKLQNFQFQMVLKR